MNDDRMIGTTTTKLSHDTKRCVMMTKLIP